MRNLLNKLFGWYYVWISYKWCGDSRYENFVRVKKTINGDLQGCQNSYNFFIKKDGTVTSQENRLNILEWKRDTTLPAGFPDEYKKN